MAKRILLALVALLFASPAIAGPYTVGTTNQPVAYHFPHVLGDGSNQRGGEAPAYAYQLADVPTGTSTVNLWTHACVGYKLTGNAPPGDDLGCGEFADTSGTNGYSVAGESKARFDCNVVFEAQDDPIINPGVQNGSMHKHTFIGNSGTGGVGYSATYATLRASGSSSCYGGVLNRTLYWEPSMFMVKNGVAVTIKPRNIVTYYLSGGITPPDGQVMSIWPRGLEFIGGFDMNDPTNHWGNDPIEVADPPHTSYIYNAAGKASTNGFVGWSCSGTASTGDWRTAYSPNQGAAHGSQPYLADAAGHPTLNCTPQSISGFGTGIQVQADVGSQNCWDGKNLTSPNGRKHMMYGVIDQLVTAGNPGGRMVCPDGWYRIPVFEAKVEFAFKDNAEMATAYLSSDRMPGMPEASFTGSISGTTLTVPGAVTGAIVPGHLLTGSGVTAGTTVISGSGTTWTVSTSQTVASTSMTTPFNNAETMHFDLIPAWDYGTGDAPGVFVKFMVHCAGVSVHLKNSDNTTYTDITGDPHECGTGRTTATENMLQGTVPDGTSLPNPITNLNPNQVGPNRFFPLPVGTPLPGTIFHTHP